MLFVIGRLLPRSPPQLSHNALFRQSTLRCECYFSFFQYLLYPIRSFHARQHLYGEPSSPTATGGRINERTSERTVEFAASFFTWQSLSYSWGRACRSDPFVSVLGRSAQAETSKPNATVQLVSIFVYTFWRLLLGNRTEKNGMGIFALEEQQHRFQGH